MYNFEIKKASNIYNLLWYTFSLNVLIYCIAFLFLLISLVVNSSIDKKSNYKYMLVNVVILIALILVTYLHG
jgi:uncharacterized membrane protein